MGFEVRTVGPWVRSTPIVSFFLFSPKIKRIITICNKFSKGPNQEKDYRIQKRRHGDHWQTRKRTKKIIKTLISYNIVTIHLGIYLEEEALEDSSVFILLSFGSQHKVVYPIPIFNYQQSKLMLYRDKRGKNKQTI